jgi:hypothetical protein
MRLVLRFSFDHPGEEKSAPGFVSGFFLALEFFCEPERASKNASSF